jgi:O-antigen/teichoic acid export membrane protein
MTAGLLTSIATVLTVGMTAARVFRAQVAMFSVVVGTNIAACALLVPRLGVLGAALAPVMSGLIHVLIAGVLIFHVSSRQARSSGYAHMGNSGLNRWEASL